MKRSESIRVAIIGAGHLGRIHAKLIQQEGRLGVIKPGAIADLIVLSKNPLENLDVLSGQGEGIEIVIKDGLIVKSAV